ncbi:MAG: FAD-dependent oxidoreductase [Planctomycetes bacterium]|nr:FAD-dependent oxidoreductase [Planctomycetota bacterium]
MGPADTDFDVIIIGAGPAGSSAAIYTSRANLRTLVIDKGIKSGALGITNKIENYPGVKDSMSGEALIDIMHEQAKSFGAEFLKTKVTGTDFNTGRKAVFTSEGNIHYSKVLLLATGAMGKSKFIAGEESLLGKGVSYCATCDGAFFKDKTAAVIGSNEEALEEALFLTRFVRKLYIISQRNTFDASDEIISDIKSNPLIEIKQPDRALSINGNEKVESVTISRVSEENKTDLPVDGVFIFTQGNKPVIDYLAGQVPVDQNSCMHVDHEMQTTISGVFACGDILCNDVQQAVVAAAQGCIAALAIDKYINKKTKFAKDYK